MPESRTAEPMRRAAWLLVLSLLIATASIGCEAGRADHQAAQIDLMDEALKIAALRQPDGLTRLRAMREQTTDVAVQDYIGIIIDRWDEAKMTYISARPIQAAHECLPLTPEDRFTVRTATQIAFKVEVDEHGRATSVELFGGTNDPELARRMKESIAKQRFVPANDESGMKRGKLTVVCRVEVR